MPPPKIDIKRKRKRKARTEVSSSSESSSSSSESDNEHRINSSAEESEASTRKTISADDKDLETHDGASESQAPAQLQKTSNTPEQAFEEFYLRQATTEFANDIDKLRSAPDFNERHVPVLIQALRQGMACFSEEERTKIVAVVEAK